MSEDSESADGRKNDNAEKALAARLAAVELAEKEKTPESWRSRRSEPKPWVENLAGGIMGSGGDDRNAESSSSGRMIHIGGLFGDVLEALIHRSAERSGKSYDDARVEVEVGVVARGLDWLLSEEDRATW